MRALLAVLALISATAAVAQDLPPAATETVDFAKQIQPIFEQRCVGCHGPGQQFNGLRLDRKADALKGGASGPAILPGDSANSRLIHLVAGYQVKVVMPPTGDPLTAQQVGLLRAWIDQGANWPDDNAAAETKPTHWAYQPRTKPTPPTVADARTAIDQFVLARLQSEQIEPSPEANRRTLLRRLSLDLTGLPPTRELMQTFLADEAPQAYENAVDSLLASEHYGEKWAMHWLDQVRYADSDGYEKDNVRPNAWRYRHWVIEALNRDMGFDEFTIEQIAGDLLENPTADQLTATGFHRNTLKNREGGVNYEQFRFEENVDRVHTVATVWLGSTIGCSQCHNHKFDPFLQQDFYRLFAFFNNIEEGFAPAPLPGELGPYLQTHDEYRTKRAELLAEYHVPEMQPAWEERVIHAGQHPGEDTAWDVNWDTLAKMTDGGERFILMPATQRNERQRDDVVDYFIRFYNQVVSKERYEELGWKELQEKLKALETSYPQLSQARIVSETPRQSHVHVRGQWDRRGVEVSAGVPGFLPQIDNPAPNRLDLARWIVADDNPLTARVIVNRIWQEYFGTGLVASSDDFGTQGDKPSHAALLDWLASDFIESGWSLKHLHRQIVMSSTYRQSSNARPELEERDPDNRLLARQLRLRLPAELIRDSALSAGGLLYDKVGGRSVRPPQPDSVSKLIYGNGVAWEEDTGPDQYRRALYIHFQRMAPYPFLMNFDGGERAIAACTRERSNTPLQALNMLNDPVLIEAAQGLATRILLESPDTDFGSRLAYAYETALGRTPSATEQQRLAVHYRDQQKLLDSDVALPAKWYPLTLEGIDRTDAAAWTAVARVLINTDEFITRE
ncbi:MAG: PSD1 and planctomycete cytochrome C domain-containing protein [Acidobacteria bacterium]|nr:PSD1 and planctomycete cytochrome C domain-containing protein [Acidobacteriota bacterium]MDA1234689.1 PSD1 and planctomycete cytochrome C domain-containing protein [Acidobacteriota bacterium]